MRICHLFIHQLPPEPDVGGQQHGLAVEVAQMQPAAARERMRGRQGEVQVLLLVALAGEPVLLHGAGQDDQLICPLAQPVQQYIVRAHFRGYCHIGVEMIQRRQDLPQRGGSARADQDGALLPVKGLHGAHHILRLPEELAGMLDGKLPVRVQFDPVFLPVEQGNLHVCLQPLHGTAERRLGQVQLLRCRGERAAVGKCDQLGQLVKFKHRGITSQISGWLSVLIVARPGCFGKAGMRFG